MSARLELKQMVSAHAASGPGWPKVLEHLRADALLEFQAKLGPNVELAEPRMEDRPAGYDFSKGQVFDGWEAEYDSPAYRVLYWRAATPRRVEE